MSKKVLSVSWLNGRVKAAVCKGTQIGPSWECLIRVDHVGELTPILRQAISALKFKGATVTFVLDHRQLTYHLQEIPPGKPKALRPLVVRKIVQARFFDEEAAWGHHPPLPGKGTQRLLLTLLPRSVITGLCGVCSEVGLIPVGVFSPSALLATQFKHLHLQAGESALLVADLGDTLCLVAGRGDGQILFCRSISASGSHHRARAGQEINRTLLYVQQQFGLPINTVWVFGNTAFEWLSALQIRDGLSVRRSPVEDNPFYFAGAATTLPTLDANNLIPESETRARLFRQRFGLAAAVLLLASLAVSFAVDKVARERETELARWTRTWNQLEKFRDTLLFRQREVTLLENQLATISSPEEPPVVDLFVHSLANTVPKTVKLTGLSMSKSNPGYTLRLEGYTLDQEAPFIPFLEEMESSLTNGLFQVQITDSTRMRMFGGSDNLGTDNRNSILNQGNRRFFINGRFE